MADATCHYCARPPQAECHTCGRLYCSEHGEDVCLRCLSPEAATPSVLVFRGAILALIVGTALTIFLVLRPPESASKADSVKPLATPTLAGGLPTATPTRPGSQPTRSATAVPTTPAASSTANSTPGTTGQTYTVVAGDSLSGIAARFSTTQAALIEANPGLTENIKIGQVLKIPAGR